MTLLHKVCKCKESAEMQTKPYMEAETLKIKLIHTPTDKSSFMHIQTQTHPCPPPHTHTHINKVDIIEDVRCLINTIWTAKTFDISN